MSNWQADDIDICKHHGNYVDNGDGCPKCRIQFNSLDTLITALNDSVQTANNQGLATDVDFAYDIPRKVGKTPKWGRGSQKWEYKDHKLDSTNEKDRFLFLESLEERGIITALDTQFTIVIMPPVTVFANQFFEEFTQTEEIYTVDFIYKYKGYNLYEDAKAPRFTPKKKLLKPRVKASSATKAKALQEIMQNMVYSVFLYSVFHKGTWHYFNTMLKESDFCLE